MKVSTGTIVGVMLVVAVLCVIAGVAKKNGAIAPASDASIAYIVEWGMSAKPTWTFNKNGTYTIRVAGTRRSEKGYWAVVGDHLFRSRKPLPLSGGRSKMGFGYPYTLNGNTLTYGGESRPISCPVFTFTRRR